MYPDIAEKDFIPAVLTQATKQKPVKLIAQAQTVTATAVIYEVGKGFEMIRPIVHKEWWEDIHIRHSIRIYSSAILFLIGLFDLVLSVFGFGYWDVYLDILWIVGSVGLLGASTYMAIDSEGK